MSRALKAHRQLEAWLGQPGAALCSSKSLLLKSCLGSSRACSAARAGSTPSALDHLAARLTTSLLTLGDVASAVPAAPAEAVSNAASAAADAAAGAAVSSATAVQAATDAATEAVKSDGGGGFFGPFAWAFESSLKARHMGTSQQACQARWWRQAVLTGGALLGEAQVLDSGLSMLHVPYSYGFAIILLTIIVKALTFPLSRKQARCVSSLPKCRPLLLCCAHKARVVALHHELL